MAENRTNTSTKNRTTVTDPLRMLRADHREVARILNRLADSDEGTERDELAQDLHMKLTLHMQIEEELVYPLVTDLVGHDDEEEAEIEHTLARDGLDKLLSMTAAPGFGAVVEMLKAGIDHHVKEEEKELLPALKDAMERDEWRALGEQVAAAKEAAGQPVKIPSNSAGGRRSSKRTTRP
jgi:iron-sulfur cluster repair protein YtfE (RIC family)